MFIEGYEIGGLIGRGAMADVYAGRHLGLDRPVAIKFLKESLVQDEEFLVRFQHEARICAKLDYAGIVHVHDSGVTQGRPYLVMEYLEGKSLRERMKKGPLSEAQAITIARWILAGLGKAHAKKVIHRDLSSGNIFLCQDGTVRIMDFGIAKIVDEQRMTSTRNLLGTVEYMSPEQAEGRSPDERSDLYSVGVLLFEMLTGHPPFQADQPVAVLFMHTSKPPEIPETVSPPLRAALEKALAKKPEERYQSASEMWKALEFSSAKAEPASDRIASVTAPRLPSQMLVRWSVFFHSASENLGAVVRVAGLVTVFSAVAAILLGGILPLSLELLSSRNAAATPTVSAPVKPGPKPASDKKSTDVTSTPEKRLSPSGKMEYAPDPDQARPAKHPVSTPGDEIPINGEKPPPEDEVNVEGSPTEDPDTNYPDPAEKSGASENP